LEKGELLPISPLVIGAEIPVLLVRLAVIPCPMCCYPQHEGCAVSAGGSKPEFHTGAEMDRVNGFACASEAPTNRALPDCSGKQAAGFLPSAPGLASVLQAAF